MRWSKTSQWILSMIFGLFLAVLGLPEAPAYHGEGSLAQEAHPHEVLGSSTNEASDHCHPGLDCSVPVAVLLQPKVVYEPQFLKAVMQDGATQRTELRPTSDPPPPRQWV
jgi:hypothetical protein